MWNEPYKKYRLLDDLQFSKLNENKNFEVFYPIFSNDIHSIE